MSARPPPARLAGLVALLAWAIGLWLRQRHLEATALDQSAIQWHLWAALVHRGDAWPGVGPPAAFFIRHGAVNAWIVTLWQPLVDSLLESARAAVFLRSLAIPGLFLLGRALGAPAIGAALAVTRAFSPVMVELDRWDGGTYFLDVALIAVLWALVSHARRPRWWLLALAGLGLGALPLIHPMGLASAAGLALAAALLLREASPRARWTFAAAVAAPLLPYVVVDAQAGFGIVRSLWGMASGALVFWAPGEDAVGLPWTLGVLATTPAPWVIALPSLTAFLAAPVALARARRRVGILGRGWRRPVACGVGAAGLALLLLLLAVQLGAGYAHRHHVLSAHLLGGTLAMLAWGGLAEARWGVGRARAEAWLAVVLALAMAPFSFGMVRGSLWAAGWAPSPSSIGAVDSLAEAIASHRGGGPLHLALVHAPSAAPAPSVALSAVVLGLLHRGVPLEALPQHPPADGRPVEGWLVLVGDDPDGLAAPAPGREIAWVDPQPEVRHGVRLLRVDRYEEILGWTGPLPEPFAVYGTEEYQDVVQHLRARPRWPTPEATLPVMESPYRSSDW